MDANETHIRVEVPMVFEMRAQNREAEWLCSASFAFVAVTRAFVVSSTFVGTYHPRYFRMTLPLISIGISITIASD
eukprot:3328924-Rhodomonas_salina.2